MFPMIRSKVGVAGAFLRSSSAVRSRSISRTSILNAHFRGSLMSFARGHYRRAHSPWAIAVGRKHCLYPNVAGQWGVPAGACGQAHHTIGAPAQPPLSLSALRGNTAPVMARQRSQQPSSENFTACFGLDVLVPVTRIRLREVIRCQRTSPETTCTSDVIGSRHTASWHWETRDTTAWVDVLLSRSTDTSTCACLWRSHLHLIYVEQQPSQVWRFPF